MPGQLFQHRVVLIRFRHYRDEVMVLRGGADQRRSADVDVLDAFVIDGALRRRRLERVQIHHDQIDRRDAMLRHLCHMFRQIAPPKDAAVDLRHERLHPTVEDFGKTAVFGHLGDRDASVAQRSRRSSGGQDCDPRGRQRRGERHEPCFVGHGNQRAANSDDIGHGGSRLLPWRRIALTALRRQTQPSFPTPRPHHAKAGGTGVPTEIHCVRRRFTARALRGSAPAPSSRHRVATRATCRLRPSPHAAPDRPPGGAAPPPMARPGEAAPAVR